MTSPYASGLDKNRANYVPLSPLSYLERAAYVYPDRISVIHGTRRFTWRETYARCRRLASALAAQNVGAGDTVAVMLPNVPAAPKAVLAPATKVLVLVPKFMYWTIISPSRATRSVKPHMSLVRRWSSPAPVCRCRA